MKLILNRYTPNTIQIQDLVKNIQQGYILIQPSSLKDKFDDLLIKNNFYKCDILYIDDYVLPEIVRVVRKLSKKYNIESITTLCEEDMTVAGLLNDYFVSGNSVSSSNISFKDKYVMRSFLIDIVKQPYFRLITDIDDIRKFFEKSTVDTAIVKPRRDGEVKWVPNFENIPWITQSRCFVYKDEITNAAQSVAESTFYCIFISETLEEYSKNIRFVQEKQSKIYLENSMQQ